MEIPKASSSVILKKLISRIFDKKIIKMRHWSCNAPDVYSVGNRFKSLLDHRPFRPMFLVIFFSQCRWLSECSLETDKDYFHSKHFQFRTQSFHLRLRPWRPVGLCDVESPTFSRQSAHRWRWDCEPHAPAALYPPVRFLALISVSRFWVDTRAIMWREVLRQLKNPQRKSKQRTSGLQHSASINYATACRLRLLLIKL
jgi:hypothetical protein